MKHLYIAEDGKEFDTEEACKDYENSHEQKEVLFYCDSYDNEFTIYYNNIGTLMMKAMSWHDEGCDDDELSEVLYYSNEDTLRELCNCLIEKLLVKEGEK